MPTYQVPNTDLTIQIAKASQVYADRDIAGKSLRPNSINKYLAMQLHVASAVLEWTRDNTPTSSYLKPIKNYTLALAGQYIVEATTNIGTGGIVITPTHSAPMGFEGYRTDFIVGTAGSPMLDGDTVLTINLDGFIPKTVFMFPFGAGILPIGLPPNAFNIISTVYTTTSVIITLDQAVHDGEGYTVTGLRYAAASSVPSGGTGLPPQTGHEGEVLFTDGTNPYWADTHIDYTSADFEPDGITVLDTRLAHNTFDLFLESLNRDLISDGDNPEFTRINGGGYVINLEGFNANTQDQRLRADLKGLNS